MSLESCKWVQPFPRARERLAPHALQYGQHRQSSNWPDKARFQGRKIPAAQPAAGIFIAGDVRSVGADVHGAQAHAAAGFDPALLQAAVQTGVDIYAAEADADGGTPAIAMASGVFRGDEIGGNR